MRYEDVIIVIPARGGSKGLPRKNARTLAGIPLLQWTVDAVRAANLGRPRCILSTDDVEIAAIAESIGLEVPFLRPTELATDTASAVSVILHALDWMRLERQTEFRSVMLLQPTSPFRPPNSLVEGLTLLGQPDVEAVIGVKPIYRDLSVLFRADERFELGALADAEHRSRRQDVEPLHTPNGALYLTFTDVLRREGTLFPRRTRGLPMDQIASLDIDDAIDWTIAEALVAAGATWREAGFAGSERARC
jgi:CMP-N,N'-diacetyllegionaminic acid synthase